jgi:predicted transcriptional regulator
MFRNMSSEEVRPTGDAADADERRELDLTDPKAMRALAHPVRMALIELFALNETLTATQASELLGESPANCAFHLRTLAKYGFVAEAGGGRGRERPWRVVFGSINVGSFRDNPQAALAADVLTEAWHERVFQRARRALTRSNAPEGWEDAQTSSQTVMFITADELEEIDKDVRTILDRYRDRKRDPALRPPGALPVELIFMAYALTEPASSGSASDPANGDSAEPQSS